VGTALEYFTFTGHSPALSKESVRKSSSVKFQLGGVVLPAYSLSHVCVQTTIPKKHFAAMFFSSLVPTRVTSVVAGFHHATGV